MDIIKITGAAVVLMSSFMLGMYFVVVNKMRIKNLADIDETWRIILAEIRFQSGSLPEIFKRFASHEYSFGIKALYKDVYENMVVDSEKAAFDIIWSFLCSLEICRCILIYRRRRTLSII